MFETLKSLMPSLEVAFEENASEFNQRFDDERERQHLSGLASPFTQAVRAVFNAYSSENERSVVSGKRFVPEKTQQIIRDRFVRLGELLRQAEQSGEDDRLLLYVLSLVFIEDEGRIASFIDPLDYQSQLVGPLKSVLRQQAREGFAVSLPKTEETQRTFIQALQVEVTQLMLQNSKLEREIAHATEGISTELAAAQACIQSGEQLMEELKRQAKAQVQPEEVRQARLEARAVFKARLGITEHTHSVAGVAAESLTKNSAIGVKPAVVSTSSAEAPIVCDPIIADMLEQPGTTGLPDFLYLRKLSNQDHRKVTAGARHTTRGEAPESGVCNG